MSAVTYAHRPCCAEKLLCDDVEPCSSEGDGDRLAHAVLEAIKNVSDTLYPVKGMLADLSELQKQLVKAAERLRGGPHQITFEVCLPCLMLCTGNRASTSSCIALRVEAAVGHDLPACADNSERVSQGRWPACT